MTAASSALHPGIRSNGPGPRRRGPSLLVLGLDPGLHRTGYGAVALDDGRPRIAGAGVLNTKPQDGLGRRLHRLFCDVEELLREMRPDVVVLEDLFVHRAFPRSALTLGHARGIIYLAAAGAGVRVLELPPSVVKQAVTGSGRASKVQVQSAIRTLLAVPGLSNTHAADALALAYVGIGRAGGRR